MLHLMVCIFFGLSGVTSNFGVIEFLTLLNSATARIRKPHSRRGHAQVQYSPRQWRLIYRVCRGLAREAIDKGPSRACVSVIFFSGPESARANLCSFLELDKVFPGKEGDNHSEL